MFEPVAKFIQGKTESFIEGELLKVAQEMGLVVDREELLKALKYDRGQYEKGYRDGCRDSQRCGRWIAVPSSDMSTGKAYKCSECSKMRYGSYHPNYCQYCGAKMDGCEQDE